MKLLLVSIALLVAFSEGLSLISSRTSPGESGELALTGTRVWIRTAGVAAFSPIQGNWRQGDTVWDRFGTNAGLYNSATDTDGASWSAGIECRYESPAHFATPVFQGCWPGFNDSQTRQDPVDPDYSEGRELCVVSSITTYVQRYEGDGSNKPVLINNFPVQVTSPGC